jgi:glycosyltransferase involved in cell wall biosynthesis
MSAAPTFTIVMPAFNAAPTLAPAIRSVFAQTREDFQLVVVDDGSTDET